MGRKAELKPELGIVAQLGVRIQRQVIGEQIEVVGQQQSQALLQPARHATVLAAPEQSVVDKNRICLRRHSRFNQREAGRHARDDFAHLAFAFDLQAVGPVVLETLGLQKLIKFTEQLSA